MLKFFGISKKDKITVKDTSKIFTVALNKVINDGYPEIQSFLNKNNNLEKSPNISDEEIKWFRLIIFVGNLHVLSTKFEENESLELRNEIIDKLLPYLDDDPEVRPSMIDVSERVKRLKDGSPDVNMNPMSLLQQVYS